MIFDLYIYSLLGHMGEQLQQYALQASYPKADCRMARSSQRSLCYLTIPVVPLSRVVSGTRRSKMVAAKKSLWLGRPSDCIRSRIVPRHYSYFPLFRRDTGSYGGIHWVCLLSRHPNIFPLRSLARPPWLSSKISPTSS